MRRWSTIGLYNSGHLHQEVIHRNSSSLVCGLGARPKYLQQDSLKKQLITKKQLIASKQKTSFLEQCNNNNNKNNNSNNSNNSNNNNNSSSSSSSSSSK
jgi:hypothetical protein